MTRWAMTKVLLRKEWRQHRLTLWLAALLMSASPLLSTLLYLLLQTKQTTGQRIADPIQRMVQDGDATMFTTVGFWFALLFGAWLLAQERGARTLEFLASTPARRKDLINSKFLLGGGAIFLIWLVNFGGITLLSLVLGNGVTFAATCTTFAVVLAALLCVYSLSFWVSTLIGQPLVALAVSVAVSFAPFAIMHVVVKSLASLGVLSWGEQGWSLRLLQIGDHLTPAAYLQVVGTLGHGISGQWLAVIGLLIAACVFYRLSLWTFERNSLERNGQFWMLVDDSKKGEL